MASPPKPFCVLVVDDEAPARRRLADRLRQDAEVGRILQAENGIAAVEVIQQANPDIVFLDVQMPGVDGFGVIDAIGLERMPPTIFVTAYDDFALRAFEADAIDYLLKPFGNRRFDMTLERVKRRLHMPVSGKKGSDSFGPELVSLVTRRVSPGAIWDWVVVKSREETRLIMTRDIDWVEASGVYVTVHSAGRSFLYRASLTTFANRLDPFHFVRIHRSSIVNLRSIAMLERRSHGEFDAVLKDGTCLLISRNYRPGLEERLGQTL